MPIDDGKYWKRHEKSIIKLDKLVQRGMAETDAISHVLPGTLKSNRLRTLKNWKERGLWPLEKYHR